MEQKNTWMKTTQGYEKENKKEKEEGENKEL